MADEKTPEAEPEVVEPIEAEPEVEQPSEVKAEPVEETPVAEPVVEGPLDNVHYVAIRDFGARYAHQILRFVKDDIIDPVIGHHLRSTGSPIKLVEKTDE